MNSAQQVYMGVCVFVWNKNLSSLKLARQMFSTMGAYKDGS